MLTFSSKSKYGLIAVLSLAGNYGQGLLQIKDIAAQNNIPHQYLGQIFNILGKAGVITSVRGKSGGYKLSNSPQKVTALDIFELLEGGIEFADNQKASNDAINELLHNAESSLRNTLKTTLAELLSRQQKKNQILTFNI